MREIPSIILSYLTIYIRQKQKLNNLSLYWLNYKKYPVSLIKLIAKRKRNLKKILLYKNKIIILPNYNKKWESLNLKSENEKVQTLTFLVRKRAAMVKRLPGMPMSMKSMQQPAAKCKSHRGYPTNNTADPGSLRTSWIVSSLPWWPVSLLAIQYSICRQHGRQVSFCTGA